MNIKDITSMLMGYIPEQYRKYVPLVGLVLLGLLALFGSRYLTPELQAEIRAAVQTAIAPTATVIP